MIISQSLLKNRSLINYTLSIYIKTLNARKSTHIFVFVYTTKIMFANIFCIYVYNFLYFIYLVSEKMNSFNDILVKEFISNPLQYVSLLSTSYGCVVFLMTEGLY